jgi:hypothetical protein
VDVVSGTIDEAVQRAFENQVRILREKILFGLSIYPAMSPSMIHVFVGPAQPKEIWKDVVLAQLIEEGEVIKTEVQLTSPLERSQTYTVLHRKDYTYTPPATTTSSDPNACDEPETKIPAKDETATDTASTPDA